MILDSLNASRSTRLQEKYCCGRVVKQSRVAGQSEVGLVSSQIQ
jgi:hypothetical protein